MSILIFLAPLLTTIGYGYYATNRIFAAYLAYISDISIMLATALCGVLMIIAMISAFRKEQHMDGDKKPDENKLADERFRVVVIGVHMLSTLVTLLVQSMWFWYSGVSSLTPNQVVMIMFSSIAAAALVYVIEFRVRKNEFMQVIILVTMVHTTCTAVTTITTTSTTETIDLSPLLLLLYHPKQSSTTSRSLISSIEPSNYLAHDYRLNKS